jgi:hypothetical protein
MHRTRSAGLPALVGAAVVLIAGQAFGQIDLNGHWNSADFGVVRIVQDSEGDVYVLAPQNDRCGRTIYLSGFLEGDKLIGSMWRCTERSLVDYCQHPPRYKTDFTASVTRSNWPFVQGEIQIESQHINIDFKMEFWNTTTCKQEKDTPLADLVMRDAGTIVPRPTPTPTPTPPTQYQTNCTWDMSFFEYLHCLGWEWDLLDSPYPNGQLK